MVRIIADVLLALGVFIFTCILVLAMSSVQAATITYKKPTVRLATKLYTENMIYPYTMQPMNSLKECKQEVMRLSMQAFENISKTDGVIRAEYSCMSVNYGITVDK